MRFVIPPNSNTFFDWRRTCHVGSNPVQAKSGARFSNEDKGSFRPVSRKSRKPFGPEKPFVNLPTACSGKPFF